MFFSFDIFDTCLVRLCGTSGNLFEILGHQVANQIATKDHTQPVDHDHLQRLFVAARKDYNGFLDDVYQKINEIFPLPCSPKVMAGNEMSLEKKMLVPVVKTLNLVNRCRQKGNIAFISDMYLPSSFLKDRLREYGFFKDGDLLFISDDIGAWKKDGSLYKYIHNKHNIPYRKWYHFGDNRNSDIRIPRQLGIRVHHLNYSYSPYEKEWLKLPKPFEVSAAIMAGLSRATRLSVPADEDQLLFVSDITAPLVTLWTSDILDDASRRGIERLYYCARDMHSAYHIAKILTRELPQFNKQKIYYLFTSQKALENNSQYTKSYYRQIGLDNTELTAIVDSRTRGWSLDRLQHSISMVPQKPMMSYYLWLDSKKIEERAALAKYPIHALFHTGQITYDKRSQVSMIDKVSGLLENGLSLNFHKKTIGYVERKDKSIGPVFETESDDINANMPNVRKIKYYNDALLKAYAIGFARCGLDKYTHDLIHSTLFPTLIRFASAPTKTYLNYLTRIWILGADHPYVCSIFNSKNRKGRWLFGSIVYSLPSWVGKIWLSLRYNTIGRKIRKWIRTLE